MELLVGCDGGEDLLLDRGWAELKSGRCGSRTHLDAVEHRRVEHVDTGVDTVSYKLDWLLDEAVNDSGSRLGDDDTVSRRLSNLCDLFVRYDRLVALTIMEPSHPCFKWKSLGSVGLLEFGHAPERLKGVCASDVRVEDKEGRVVLAEDVTGEREGAGLKSATFSQLGLTSAEGLGLDGKVDGDAILLLGLLEDRDHDFGAVVDSEDNVLDAGLG